MKEVIMNYPAVKYKQYIAFFSVEVVFMNRPAEKCERHIVTFAL